jgi:hypothetical protein
VADINKEFDSDNSSMYGDSRNSSLLSYDNGIKYKVKETGDSS